MRKPAILTIDDGPSPDRPLLLKALEQRGIRAIFFSEGKYLEQQPELALATLRAGHHLANHAWSHPQFSVMSVATACSEIVRTHEIIAKCYANASIAPQGLWFRFPFGDKGDGKHGFVFNHWRRVDKQRFQSIQSCLIELGYQHLKVAGDLPTWYAPLYAAADTHWTFDPMEWSLNQTKPVLGIKQVEDVLNRLSQRNPKDIRGLWPWEKRWLSSPNTTEIVVMHDQIGLGRHFEPILDALSAYVEWKNPV
jgi:peptidoglycan-N-acetylglucosamine deacetylase